MNTSNPTRILFITTHNLATNPRLYKEVMLALAFGYKPEIICFEFDNWSKAINEQLKEQLGAIKIISIPAGRKPFYTWIYSVVSETIFRKTGRYFSMPVPALSQAVSRRSRLLINALGKVSTPDWVIGHNPGALWPAVKAAKKFNCKVGFDVEDYHPGEGNDKGLQNLTQKLMIKLLPKMNYVSFAGPLILQQVKKDVNARGGNWFTVLNYFPATEFIEPAKLYEGPIKMIWFSQNINAGRGLELILPLVKKSTVNIELHLIGNLDPDFYDGYLKGISNIFIHAAMEQKELHQELGQFDIGLALDIPADKNRDLVITNKLLAYLQSGLYILATNTSAQVSFLNEFPEHGQLFDYATNNSEAIFEKITTQISFIRSQNKIRYKNFEKRNWETASVDLLNAWKK